MTPAAATVCTRCLHALVIPALLFAALPASQLHRDENQGILKLQSYEPTTLGITFDDNDVSFMDFKLSQKYPMFHDGRFDKDNPAWHHGLPYLYFAFTGRFGQYIGTRHSSPVVAKRFNPKLFGRYWFNSENDHLDIGYAHESNGQSITTLGAYEQQRAEFASEGQDPDFANDAISRGWDYLEATLKKGYRYADTKSYAYLNIKYFLPHGLLQGGAEEYNAWEGRSDGKPRKSVDGVSLLLKSSRDFRFGPLIGDKYALIYTTGYKDMFRYHTLRLEATLKIGDIPVMLWYSDGYNSDLADYYKRVGSYGIALELKNFLGDI